MRTITHADTVELITHLNARGAGLPHAHFYAKQRPMAQRLGYKPPYLMAERALVCKYDGHFWGVAQMTVTTKHGKGHFIEKRIFPLTHACDLLRQANDLLLKTPDMLDGDFSKPGQYPLTYEAHAKWIGRGANAFITPGQTIIAIVKHLARRLSVTFAEGVIIRDEKWLMYMDTMNTVVTSPQRG